MILIFVELWDLRQSKVLKSEASLQAQRYVHSEFSVLHH